MKPGPKRRVIVTQPPRPTAARAPRGMSAGGRKAWRALAPRLAEAGALTVLDEPALLLLCESYRIALDALAKVRADGITVPGWRGGDRKHPALQVARDFGGLFLQLAADFGMLPSTRHQVQAEHGVGGDLAELLFGPTAEGKQEQGTGGE